MNFIVLDTFRECSLFMVWGERVCCSFLRGSLEFEESVDGESESTSLHELLHLLQASQTNDFLII